MIKPITCKIEAFIEARIFEFKNPDGGKKASKKKPGNRLKKQLISFLWIWFFTVAIGIKPVIAQTTSVLNFNLINAVTDQPIQQLTEGATLNLATLPTRSLNIQAVTSPGTVGSVGFNVTGQQIFTRSDESFPYSCFKDNAGNYAAWTPAVGSYTLTARPFTGANGSGTPGAALTVNFSVIDNANPVQYTLTVNTVGGGSVSKNPNLASYNSGSNVVLTATANTGFQFTGWSGDATGTTNPLTVNMNGNKTITATFTPVYTLSVTVNGSGLVVKSPDQSTYLSGSTVNLTAQPGVGYAFSGWSGDVSGAANPLSVNMDGNKSITATFTPIQYNLNITENGNGTVAKNPDQFTYNSGSSVVLTANPNPGYRFSGWSGDASGSTNPLTVLMNSDKNITATFIQIPPQQTLTVSIIGSGTVIKNPDQPTYDYAATVSLTANPAAGFRFAGWSGDTTGTANPIDLKLKTDKHITAIFKAVPQYSLNISITGNGTVIRNPNLAVYDSGTTVNLTPSGAVNYQFSAWSGDATGTTNPLAVLIDSDKNITATFTIIQYTLGIATIGNGSVTKDPSQPTYDSGSEVILTASPDPNYQFTGWSGNASGTTNPLTVNMNTNKNITATFTPVYTLSTSVNGSGSIVKTPDQAIYLSGANVSLQANPAAGFQFAGWSGDAS